MGQSASLEDSGPRMQQTTKSDEIRTLMTFARNKYEENPTEALSALLQALTLNGGNADHAMDRLRNELGDDIADHVSSSTYTRQQRLERAMAVVEELLQDENTILYQQGRQDLLRQTMQDGSSVVCSNCNDVVSSSRWQQHQQYWCSAIGGDGESNGSTMEE